MKMPTITDARGNQSTTLCMVSICLVVLLAKFISEGLETPLGTVPVMGAVEFGLAASGLIFCWVHRDNKQKALEAQERISRGR